MSEGAVTPEEMRRRLHQQQDRARAGRPMSRTESLQRAHAASPPERAAVKHAAYIDGVKECWEGCPLHLTGRCGDCEPGIPCPHELQACEQYAAALTDLVRADQVLDMRIALPIIADVALRRVRYNRLVAWAAIMPEVSALSAAVGEFVVQAGHRDLDRFAQSWERGLDQLGLSYAARLKLRADARGDAGLPGLVAGVYAAQQLREAATVVDTEFEEEQG